MIITVIDGQGGNIGKQLVKSIRDSFPDALLGEVTPAMAKAVGESPAKKVLIPLNKCDVLVAGITNRSANELLEDAMDKIRNIMKET